MDCTTSRSRLAHATFALVAAVTFLAITPVRGDAALPGPVEYIGPPGGTWFDETHWSSGLVPDAATIVLLAASVVVDQPGATALDVTMDGGGDLDITTGSLDTPSMAVGAGAALSLSDVAAELTIGDMDVDAAATLTWTDGTIVVDGGTWTHAPGSLLLGCFGTATLRLADGTIIASTMQVCPGGTVTGVGLVDAQLNNAGTVSPGSPIGILEVKRYKQVVPGVLRIELDGTAPDSTNDVLDTVQNLDAGGTLEIATLGGFAPEVGTLRSIIWQPDIVGTFDAFTFPPLTPDVTMLAIEDGHDVELLTMVTGTGPRLYVDAARPPGGNGQTWGGATRLLDSALLVAAYFPGTVTEIWVAAGTYLPTLRPTTGNPNTAAFDLVEGASIYGGFAGTETMRDERDPDLNVTILSGDHNGDDAPGFLNRAENAGTLLRGEAEAAWTMPTAVDGLEFRGGGGALSLLYANPTVTNCLMTDNFLGASLHADALVEDCTFIDNAHGMRVDGSLSAPVVRRCRFEGHATSSEGGGLTARGGTFTDCFFFDNVSSATDGQGGGGAYLWDDAHIYNSVFIGNTAPNGGAIYVGDADDVRIINCLIVGNTCDSGVGGAITVASTTAPQIVNCTIVGNHSAGTIGGVAAQYAGNNADLANCIVWGNTDGVNSGEAAQFGGPGSVSMNYCDVEGWSGGAGGAGNFAATPLFADLDGADDVPGTVDDDLRLAAGSPCVDAGSNVLLPPDDADLDGDTITVEPVSLDLDDNARRHDDPAAADTGVGPAPIVDLGCYERGAPTGGAALYVGPPGGSWFDPSNWAAGALPGPLTDVLVTEHITIDQVGAVAGNIAILGAGRLDLAGGSLTAGMIAVDPGGILFLADAAAALTATDLDTPFGAGFQWNAGTIHIVGGAWTGWSDIDVGCLGDATLFLSQDAVVNATSVHVCVTGVLGGAGTVAADVISDGLVAPGASAGALLVEGDYTQTATATLLIEVGGLVPGVEHDRITVTGTAMLDGTLEADTLPGYDPLLGFAHYLVAAAISGDFATELLPALPAGFVFASRSTADTRSLLGVPPGPVVFIDAAAGVGTGTSWGEASADLEVALLAASTPGAGIVEIWVTAGTYLPVEPTEPGDPRSATFVLPAGVSVYGGFAGGEPSLDQRDPSVNVVVLDGDVYGDDLPGFVNDAENLHHVVTVDAPGGASTLDGLTVTHGNAEFPGFVGRGGGVRVVAGAVTLRDCRLTANRAVEFGGAVFNDGGDGSVFEGCTFDGNAAVGGGAVASLGGSAADFTGCLFDGNEAGTGAAVLSHEGSITTYTACTFTGNLADFQGATIDHESGSHATISGCQFLGNGPEVIGTVNTLESDLDVSDSIFTGNGGGVSSRSGTTTMTSCQFTMNEGRAATHELADATISDCLFESNTGGGLISDESTALITGCTFLNNTSDYKGAGLVIDTAVDVTVVDCVIDGNTTSGHVEGGGVFVNGGANGGTVVTLRDCTISNNVAYRGGGVSSTATSLRMIDCVVADNSATLAGGGVDITAGSTTLANCRLEGNDTVTGGGLYTSGAGGGSRQLWNCVVAGNTATDGAGVFIGSGNVSLNHCTLVANVASGSGGGVRNDSGPVSLSAFSSILWGNTDSGGNDESAQVHLSGGATALALNCDVQGLMTLPGAFNIDADPLLESPATGDYRPGNGSPCIDAGANTAVPADTLDLDGDGDVTEPLPVDMSGDVRFFDDPAAPDCPQPGASCGTAPIVDIGAEERRPCAADVDQDGVIGVNDLVSIIIGWGTGDPDADVNDDGKVDVDDLVVVITEWGPCPRMPFR